jgi:hypothetical protein
MASASFTENSFENEIQETAEMVSVMRERIAASESALEKLAKADTIGEVDFDIENARIEDVLKQQKLMEANIADLWVANY